MCSVRDSNPLTTGGTPTGYITHLPTEHPGFVIDVPGKRLNSRGFLLGVPDLVSLASTELIWPFIRLAQVVCPSIQSDV